MFKRPHLRRLITPETAKLSRPEPLPAAPRRPYGGLVIESAEGLRFAYAATELPGADTLQEGVDPKKVEDARMCAGVIIRSEVELPVTPFPEPDIIPTKE